jgi:hypothetical protein
MSIPIQENNTCHIPTMCPKRPICPKLGRGHLK